MVKNLEGTAGICPLLSAAWLLGTEKWNQDIGVSVSVDWDQFYVL